MTTSDRFLDLAEHRGYLVDVAYRLVGSLHDAEDLVQEALVRAARAGTDDIENPRAWLRRIVTNAALDHLRSARIRREQYVGPWLPEPVVGERWDPADDVALADDLSLALLTVLESLSPAERAVYVLNEAFSVPLSEVAGIVGRSEAACRQLAVRARRHVEEHAPRFSPDADERTRVVAAFQAACTTGDVAALAQLLDDHVVLRTDGGGVAPAARRPVQGRDRVVRTVVTGLAALPAHTFERRMVNGGPGLVMRSAAGCAVVSLVVADGMVTEVDIVLNPQKLAGL